MKNIEREDSSFMKQIEELNQSEDFGEFLELSLESEEGEGEKLLENNFAEFLGKFEKGLETYTDWLGKTFGVQSKGVK